MEDAPVAIIVELVLGIDSQHGLGSEGRAILARDFHVQRLARLDIGDTGNRDLFLACQAKGFGTGTFCKFKRKHAHADQVRPVNTLEAACNDGAHAEQHGALCRPVA